MNTSEINGSRLRLEFEHNGIARTLAKHPVIRQRFKKGALTEDQAAEYPWYLRFETAGKAHLVKLTALKDKEAIREAKDYFKTRADKPNDFAEFLASKQAKRGLTVGELAKEWFDAGLPFSRTRPRGEAAANQIRIRLQRVLSWWADKPVTSIKPSTHADFVVWRRQNARHAATYAGQRGSRTADIELAALSCLCQWAVKTERIERNPFENRERFADPATINHCHLSMPGGDDEFHRILAWFFAPRIIKPVKKTGATLEQRMENNAADNRQRILVGSWLAFSALSGLRPGENIHLQRVPAVDKFPADLRSAAPGLVFPMPDGTRRMKVQRLKRGQNPAILIHPALQDFLNHYLPWLNSNYPDSLALFPLPDVEGLLNGYLRRACKSCGVKQMKPHGFGRAYYVRVRRSQGIDDSTIAAELGQKSDGSLIRSVYGDPLDPVGGNLHDWLPTEGTAAWQTLTTATVPNLIAL